MATLRRPLQFTLPYPAPTTDFHTLPQAVRDAWASWALGNKVGYLDYERIIRPTLAAYDFTVTMDMTLHGGVQGIDWPPESVTPQARTVALNLSEATIADIMSGSTNNIIEQDLDVLVWATPTAATVDAIANANNKFIGVFSQPKGTDIRVTFGDIGAAYVAAFASLAGDLGKFLRMFFWGIVNGNLRYLGSSVVAVNTVAKLALAAYWPLGEFVGTRRSIARPNNLTPIHNPGSVAGPIDFATSIDPATTQQLITNDTAEIDASQGDHTLSMWLNFTSFATTQQPLLRGTAYGIPNMQFAVIYDVGTDNLSLATSDGLANSFGPIPTYSAVGTASWHLVTWTYDATATQNKSYLDGVLQTTTGAYPQPQPLISPLQIGAEPTSPYPWTGAIAELSWWNRILTPTEIAALYNGGAGLRYPF